MNIMEAKEQIKDAVESYLDKDEAGVHKIDVLRQRPMFLLGAPGIGKTAIMEQIANELGIGLVSYSMTHHTRQSALGLPFIVEHEFEGLTYQASEYTMSEIVASLYDYMTSTGMRRGILFLDEINCVSETLYPSMLQFLQFKTFGRHRIPDDWVVVCAGNPTEYNRSAHEFDIVTLDRLRKLVVEPDYKTWRSYAVAKNLHPAIISFLDVKPDLFYSVEATVAEKSFVTARGWEDLSTTMRAIEERGKKVNSCLIGQFLQNEEIASRFSVYYELFDKYKSDYKIMNILAGQTSEDALEHAKEASFDERLAIMGLLLDSIAGSCKEVLQIDTTVSAVRDLLREVRPTLEGGASLKDSLGCIISAREEEVRVQSELGSPTINIEQEKRLINALKTMRDACMVSGKTFGSEAFDVCHYEYRGMVGALEQKVKGCQQALDNAYAFLDEAFGLDREELVFTTELTSRPNVMGFLNKFDSKSYFAHNEGLLYEGHRVNLQSRIDDLKSVMKKDVDQSKAEVDFSEMEAFYGRPGVEFGYNSLCRITLPDNMHGRRVLNIGCRRGKGVFKMSAKVGDSGSVVGVEWDVDMLQEAQIRMDRAWRDSGLLGNNMQFNFAYPEALSAAGLADGSFDMVFLNSVFNLSYAPHMVLDQAFMALKQNGLLILECVFANGKRDQSVVDAARKMGNSVQAAFSKEDLESALSSAGFAEVKYLNEHMVNPDEGSVPSHPVPMVPSDEDVTFSVAVLHARKIARG